MKRLWLVGALGATLASCALSQSSQQAASETATPLPLRALIVSGGPSLDQNEYAIESNARYVARLTQNAKWRRIHFADGKTTSRTISVVAPDRQKHERALLAWLMEWEDDGSFYERRASTLKQINGASTRPSVLQSLGFLTGSVQDNERGLLYFTGHGGTTEKPKILGLGSGEDTQNTTYLLWNDDELTVKQLAPTLQKWPGTVPLALVMVQCHAGGFANLIWQGGDPKNPVWNRDFSGFFASTGARPSAGCTPEVDERDYQDFTTHFFAALSGQTRDGKPGPKADFDGSGETSMSEAFAYTLVHDRSIDVPVSTSDTFLRRVLNEETENTLLHDWTKTPYSQLVQNATPWQKAALNGLSRELKLSGENRTLDAARDWKTAQKQVQNEDLPLPGVDEDQLWRVYKRLQRELKRRFPDLHSQDDAKFNRAETAALKWLKSQKSAFVLLNDAYAKWSRASEDLSAREAMLERFLRLTHTITLQKRLEQSGSSEQKAVFARLRKSESRNPLR